MEDLLLDSISEKLSAIDQKTTEMVKTTGEINRSIDQIRSRLAAMESKDESSVNPIQQIYPLPVKPVSHHVVWSQTSDRKIWLILVPILSAVAGMVLLSFVLTAGLRTSLLFPYLQYQNSTIQPPTSSPIPLIRQPSRPRIKSGNNSKDFRKQSFRFKDSVN